MNQTAKYYGFDSSKIPDTERESFERSCDIVAKWSNETFLTELFECPRRTANRDRVKRRAWGLAPGKA